MRYAEVVTAVCLLVVPVALGGQGLGAAAAREKAKRDKAAAKAPAASYTNDSLKPSGNSAATAGAAGAGENANPPEASGLPDAAGRTTDAATEKGTLPTCPGGEEMLLAWSAAHSAYSAHHDHRIRGS